MGTDRDGRYDAMVLLSGGPDSATLLYHLKAEGLCESPLALHFSTGLKPNDYELKASKRVCDAAEVPLQVLDISHFVAMGGNAMPTIHSDAHVLRFGTAALLSMASALAIQHGMDKVWIALHKDDADEADEYAPSFIEFMNSGLKLVGSSCSIVAPFHEMRKIDVLRRASELGVPFEKTWSCVSPLKGRQCGTCGACRARRAGAEAVELKDRSRYAF